MRHYYRTPGGWAMVMEDATDYENYNLGLNEFRAFVTTDDQPDVVIRRIIHLDNLGRDGWTSITASEVPSPAMEMLLACEANGL